MPALKNGRGADRAAARSTCWWSPKSRSLFSSCRRRLFVRTLSNLHSVQVGYARENISCSLECAPGRASRPGDRRFLRGPAPALGNRPRREQRDASQSSIIPPLRRQAIRKIRSALLPWMATRHVRRTAFLTTMRIPILAGREMTPRPTGPPGRCGDQRAAGRELTSGTTIRWARRITSRTRSAISKSSGSR